MLTRVQKESQIAELKEKFGRATCMYVADYRGVGVEAVNQLRRRIRSEGHGNYEYRVVKNTVLRLACVDTPAAEVAHHFQGPSALALSYSDPVGLAKILVEFAKENEAFELRGGLLEGHPVEQAEIATLATLPSLDVLRAKLVGLIQGPATKLVRLVSEPAGQIARVLAARGRQQDGA